MQVTGKGQVAIPKHLRQAAGVLPGTKVEFPLQGGKILIRKVAADTATGARRCARRRPRSAGASMSAADISRMKSR